MTVICASKLHRPAQPGFPDTDAGIEARFAIDVPRKSESEHRDYFDQAHAQALAAEDSSGAHAVDLKIGDTRVRLVFAGECLVPHIMPALAHLQVNSDQPPDAVLHIWDSETTGVEMVPPPCSQHQFTDRGDIWGFHNERYKIAFHWTECSVNLMDTGRGIGIFWVHTARGFPFWVHASPLRTLFHWWVEKAGCGLLHAAAFGNANGAILLTGKGGVGKSTTALSCLEAGMNYLADDYLIVGLDPEPTVYSLYSTAKLNADQVERYPGLVPYISNMGRLQDEKAVMFLYPEFGDQIALSAPIRAIVSPRIVDRPESRFAATSQLALRRAATFTTLSQLPYAGAGTYEFIDRLVDRVPGLELSLGSNLQQIPQAITAFLEDPDPVVSRFAVTGRHSGATPPLITAIIPVHNGARFLRDAIDSILAQDYPALEIIVINDGSSDNLADVVAALDVDVRYLEQENFGAAAARNCGIRHASGDYLAFLDVDDLWPADNLVILLDALQNGPGLDVAHGYGQLMEHDQATGEYVHVGNPREAYPYYIGAALYRRGVFDRVGLFDTDLEFSEDSDWFTRARESGVRMKRLEHVSLFVRRHDRNMTHAQTEVKLSTLRVLKKALDRKRAKNLGIPDSRPPGKLQGRAGPRHD